ncbi:S-adenosyl-L-methionine-dependent methyltransferase [Aeromonas phage AerS_266]|nr:S-adenosyl-L-methionine-dependent methyltransferase [Aeromonas phage AerS_266]
MLPIIAPKISEGTEIVELIKNDSIPPTLSKEKFQGKDFSFGSQWDVRCKYTRLIAWFILTTEVKGILSNYLKGKKVLEVASGTGYLAAHMKDAGVNNYTAVDLQETHYWKEAKLFEGVKGNALESINDNYDVIVMTWPEYDDPFGAKVLDKMSNGQILIYQGEFHGGCTGDDRMFELLDKQFTELEDISYQLNDNHVRFSGIYDFWGVYVKGPLGLDQK